MSKVVPEPKSRYPTLGEKPKIRDIGDQSGKPWYRTDVRRQTGSKGKGFGRTKENATDEAYKEAGGKVNTDKKFDF